MTQEPTKEMIEAASDALRKDFGDFSYAGRLNMASTALEAALAAAPAINVETVIEALNRQCDNMAFVLNKFDVPDHWYYKFKAELEEDRTKLTAPESERAQIVAFIRDWREINTEADDYLASKIEQEWADELADAIQRGEHTSTPAPEGGALADAKFHMQTALKCAAQSPDEHLFNAIEQVNSAILSLTSLNGASHADNS